MPLQLTLDFMSHVQEEEWLDVTDIARGVGFTGPVEISPTLNSALLSHQDEPEDACNQRLFDCLWLAHLHWSLSEGEAVILNFFFERVDSTEESRLRFRLELQQKVIRLGLPDDFPVRMESEESD
jgi:hypothetical protein